MDDVIRLSNSLLIEGLDDWIPDQQLVNLALELAGPGGYQSLAIEALRALLTNGDMIVGDLGDEIGVDAWDGSPEEVLARAHATLERLDWRPMSDGFWMAHSDSGRAKAEVLVSKGDAESV